MAQLRSELIIQRALGLTVSQLAKISELDEELNQCTAKYRAMTEAFLNLAAKKVKSAAY